MNRIPPTSQLLAYLRSVAARCRQPGGAARILHNLHLRQPAVQGDPRCLLPAELFSRASGEKKKNKKNHPTPSYLPGSGGTGELLPCAQRGQRHQGAQSHPNPRAGGIGSRRRAEKGRGGEHEAAAQSPELKPSPFISAPDGPAAEMQEGGWRDNSGAQHRRQLGQAAPAHRGGERGPQPLRGHSAGIYLQPHGSF